MRMSTNFDLRSKITSMVVHDAPAKSRFSDGIVADTLFRVLTWRFSFFFLKVKNGTWLQTVIQIDTTKPNRLPIVDVAAYDIGDNGEEFGLEIGPVCFY